MDNITRLIFLHVPRTSGSTLHGILARQYPEGATHTAELFLPHDVERFRNLPESRRAEIKLLKGHMAFGLHEYLPGPTRYFTMVRDPIDRLVSYYYYIRRRPTDGLYKEVMDNDVDLATFVASGMARDHTDNSLVRFLSGNPFVEQGAVDGAMVERAISNISEHFILVGRQSRFDETILMLKHELGWSTPYYRSQNVTKGRPKMAEIDDRTRAILEEHTKFDRQLYEHCVELFDAKLNSMPKGFQKELRDFRRRNKTMQKIFPLLQPLRKRLAALRS